MGRADGKDDEIAQLRAELHSMARRLDELASSPALHDYSALLRSLYAERRARDAHFADSGLLADPAWDILLDLLVQSHNGKKVSVTSACLASCVPPTTALRWIDVLVKEGLVERQDDPVDKRRAFIRLSDEGLARMLKVAEAMAQVRLRQLR